MNMRLSSIYMDVNEHETIQHFIQTQIKVKEQLVVRKDMHVNERERLIQTIQHYTQKKIKVKKQVVK